MRSIELKKYKKVGVSFEEISELIIPNYKKLEADITASVKGKYENRFLALELKLPADACYYALLGAKYMPSDEYKGLHLEIRYIDIGTERYSETLAYSEKTVFKGLSKQYAEIVLNTATEYFRSNETPNGKIVINTAAYCEIGSSPMMFTIITKTLLNLLFREQYPVTDDDIKNTCEDYLQERSGKSTKG